MRTQRRSCRRRPGPRRGHRGSRRRRPALRVHRPSECKRVWVAPGGEVREAELADPLQALDDRVIDDRDLGVIDGDRAMQGVPDLMGRIVRRARARLQEVLLDYPAARPGASTCLPPRCGSRGRIDHHAPPGNHRAPRPGRHPPPPRRGVRPRRSVESGRVSVVRDPRPAARQTWERGALEDGWQLGTPWGFFTRLLRDPEGIRSRLAVPCGPRGAPMSLASRPGRPPRGWSDRGSSMKPATRPGGPTRVAGSTRHPGSPGTASSVAGHPAGAHRRAGGLPRAGRSAPVPELAGRRSGPTGRVARVAIDAADSPAILLCLRSPDPLPDAHADASVRWPDGHLGADGPALPIG